MKNFVNPTLAAFVSLFFPKLCPGFMNPLFGKEKVIYFDCQMSLSQTDHLWEFENFLWKKMNQLLKVERAGALLESQKHSRVQSLLHQLKDKGQQEIGSFLGNWLVPQLKESNGFVGVDVVFTTAASSQTTQAKRVQSGVIVFRKFVKTPSNSTGR